MEQIFNGAHLNEGGTPTNDRINERLLRGPAIHQGAFVALMRALIIQPKVPHPVRSSASSS